MDDLNNKVPPIIADWIEKISNKNTPEHIRENYCMMLENVVLVSSKAIHTHRTSKQILPVNKKRKY